MFALTSGTTATRKYIPVTPQYLADYRRGWNIWGLKVFRDHPERQAAADRAAVRRLAGVPHRGRHPLRRRHRPDGARCRSGSSAGSTACPAGVGKVKDPAAKYYLVLRLSLPRTVGLIIAANPSTLINLARAGDQREGSADPRHPRRHAERRASTSPPTSARRWRRSSQASTPSAPASWRRSSAAPARSTRRTTGRSRLPARQLDRRQRRRLPAALSRSYYGDTPVRDVGLIASEGRMTIPFDDGTPAGVLDITTTTSSSSPRTRSTARSRPCWRPTSCEEGGNYYILLTTAYGLYRYHIHDLVRVHRLPQPDAAGRVPEQGVATSPT